MARGTRFAQQLYRVLLDLVLATQVCRLWPGGDVVVSHVRAEASPCRPSSVPPLWRCLGRPGCV